MDIDFDFFSTLNPELHPLAIRISGIKESISLISPLNLLNYCFDKKKFENEKEKEEFKLLKGKDDEITFFGRIIQKYLLSCLKNENEQIFEDCSKIARKFWCNGEEDGRRKQIQFHYFLMNLFDESDRSDVLQTSIMTANLPYFIDSKFKIRKKIELLKLSLKSLGIGIGGDRAGIDSNINDSSVPKLISICKSELDGHTPTFLIEFLKNEIFEMIKDLFL